MQRFQAAARNPHHFPRLYVAHVFRINQIQRASFRSRHPRAIQPAQTQRPESPRIANRINLIARQQQQRIRALHLVQRIRDRARQVSRLAPRDQMHDHFGITGRLKNGSAMLQFLAQLDRVGQVAVVPQRDFSLVAVNHHRLRVHQDVVARCRIPGVPDRCVARQPRNHIRRENFLHQPERLVYVHLRAIGRSYPRRFLPAMLQRIKPQVRHLRRFRVPKDPEHAAMVVKMIVAELNNFAHAFSMAFGSASLHARRNDSILPCITAAPGYWMRNSPRVTVPIRCARTLYCAAISFTRASNSGATDTTARAPRSPNNAASAKSSAPAASIEISAESPSRPKQASASETASPPSLTSCAESTARSAASATKQSINRFSAAKSIAGGNPATTP